MSMGLAAGCQRAYSGFMPRPLSILMPIHNAATTLEATMESIVAQTFEDFELVVVDDGSTDASIAIVKEIFPDSSRLRVIEPGRVGLVEALQQGFEACEGKWIARMDADDLMLPERLEAQLDWAGQFPELQIIGSEVESFRDNSTETLGEGYALYDEWLNGLLSSDAIFRERFVESPIAHPSVMFLKSAIEQIGGYQERGWPEDYDLWLRAMHHGLLVGKVPKVLLRWRDQQGRTSRVDERYHHHEFLKCKAHYLSIGPLSEKKQTVIWGAGTIGKRLGRYLREAGIEIVSYLDIDPKKIGAHSRGVPVVDACELQRFVGIPLVAAVGARGARTLIRKELHQAKWIEGSDYYCAA